jgi:hypothetical protein
VAGLQDGPGTTALFRSPEGVAVDNSGNVYVADTGNHVIRKITPAGFVSTVAGKVANGFGVAGFADGPAANAQFNAPTGVAVDNDGAIYVADNFNNRIRKISPAGDVSTLAGTGAAGFADGSGNTAQFSGPFKVAVSGPGDIVYVADAGNNRVRKIVDTTPVPTFEYAAKFVCGAAGSGGSGTAAPAVVARGEYFTAINVHNPNAQPVKLRKKFVIALPSEKQGGQISDFFHAGLIGDEAFEIDCSDILAHLRVPHGEFAKGFVVIQSPSELDVVGVYTTAATPTGTVSTFEIERVPVREKQ